jgi:hypothetical protein
MFKEAIKDGKDFDRNDIDGLDSAFHENITDRGYTPKDAIYILKACKEEETDSGIWEGLDDWRAELSARAAYSFSNDVWFKMEEIYNELKDDYEAQYTEATEEKETLAKKGDDDDDVDEDALKEAVVDQILKDYSAEFVIEPVTNRKEQIHLIKQWFEMGTKAGWMSGYPLGSSYIDIRCGTGHGMPDTKDYIEIDHELAKKIPAISGKYKSDVDEYLTKIKKMRCKDIKG